jgi:hypothetical protein
LKAGADDTAGWLFGAAKHAVRYVAAISLTASAGLTIKMPLY